MNRDSLSTADLHRLFSEHLSREAPGSTFVFEIDRRPAVGDGCNWYPLASIGAWRGDIVANLVAFRRVRERLSREYDLEETEAPAAATQTTEPEPVATQRSSSPDM